MAQPFTNAENRAIKLMPYFNQCIHTASILVSCIGLGGILGHLLRIPWLLSYVPNATVGMALPTAISIFFLGFALRVILDSQPYDQFPPWLGPVRYLSLIVPATISGSILLLYLTNPHFDILDIDTHGIYPAAFHTSIMILASVLALFIFVQRRYNESAVVYGVCIPALIAINMGILAIIGYVYNEPLLYGLKMSLSTAISTLLIGLTILMGTLPFRGLLLPFFSDNLRAQILAGLSVVMGLGILIFGIDSIAIALRLNNSNWGGNLSRNMRHLYTGAIYVTNVVSILVKVISLRAVQYYTEALSFGQEQTQLTCQQTVISELGLKALSGIDLQALMDEAVRQVLEVLDDEFGKVLKLLPNRHELLMIAGLGWKEGLVGTATVPAGPNSQAGYTFTNKEPVIVEDLSQETRFNPAPLFREHGIVSGISVVIYAGSQPWGIFGVHSNRRKHLTQDDVNFIQSVANVLGTVIERKQIEEVLQDSEARFRRIVEANMIGVIFWTVDGQITDANEAFLEMLGYTRADLEAGHLNWRDLTPPNYDELDDMNIENLRTKGSMEPFEKQYIAKDGHRVDVFVTGALMEGSDREGVAFVMDITLRKKAEANLRDSQRQLAESNRDLEYFATVASHDLQAPLRKVRIFLDMIDKQAKDQLDSESLDLLGRSKRSLASMQNLITDLLLLSKATNGGLPPQKLDIAKVVDHVLMNLEDQIQTKRATVTIESSGTVIADEVQFEQLLQNLIANALKYQPTGQEPKIHIRAECGDNGLCQIIVQDNGIGISPADQERIFEPFARLHGKSSPYEGSGVGLAICKRIVERHGGSISVNSIPGQGSRFIIKLPIPPMEGKQSSLVLARSHRD